MRTDAIASAAPYADLGGVQRPRDIKEAANAFEALFLEQLLSEMRKTVPKDGLFKRGFAEKTFQQMLDRTYAGVMAARGGVGLSDVLLRAWGETPETNSAVGLPDPTAQEPGVQRALAGEAAAEEPRSERAEIEDADAGKAAAEQAKEQ